MKVASSCCHRCKKETNVLTKAKAGDRVCRECLEKYYDKCMYCDEYVERWELDGNGGVCELCFDEEWDE